MILIMMMKMIIQVMTPGEKQKNKKGKIKNEFNNTN